MRSNPLAFLDTELDTLRSQGLHRSLRILDDRQQATTRFDHKSVVNLSSNNYLGLTTHPLLIERAMPRSRNTASAQARSGRSPARWRSTWSWKAARRLQAHRSRRRLSERIRGERRHGLGDPDEGRRDHFDALNHASIIDGCRLSKATIKVFPHKDVDACRNILKELPASQRKLLITDGVFSMDGDLGALPALCDLAEEFGCIMMVDDAHASGVFGKNGRGTVDHFKMHGRVDIQVGTLSKAMGALGGYVAGSAALIDFLYHRARPFLFSTSHPPSVAATCIAAVDVLEKEPEIIERLWDNTRFFKKGLESLGFDTGLSQSPITPVIAGEGSRAMKLSDRLFEEGVFAQGIAFPTVARDKARVRTIVTATHTKDELQFALDKFRKVGSELGLI
jgi:glycine C-acetyltransferase